VVKNLPPNFSLESIQEIFGAVGKYVICVPVVVHVSIVCYELIILTETLLYLFISELQI
jgi:hypothetical protein